MRGLTTAASLWVAAATGLAAGLGFWVGVGVSVGISLVSLAVLKPVEERLARRQSERGTPRDWETPFDGEDDDDDTGGPTGSKGDRPG